MRKVSAIEADSPQGGPTGTRRSDIRGRFPVEPAPGERYGWDTYKRGMDRNFDVDWHTGQPVSTVWPGRWNRGEFIRHAQPAMVLPPGNPMYDPTDPGQWVRPR